MTDIAQITRDQKTKKAFLHVRTDASWKIHKGKNPADIHDASLLLSGRGAGTFPLETDRLAHAIFLFEAEGQTHAIAERHTPMTGGYNIRDLGGYKGADNRYVRWGKFFRADDMAHLTQEDIDYLGSIPITTVFDFRTQREVDNAPDKLPPTVKNILHRPLAPGNVAPVEIQDGRFARYDDANAFMHVVYHELVTCQYINSVYREFMEYVQNEDKVPVLFHCTAGKDRTGVAAAFILYALGVDKKTIFQDYVDSNTYLADKYSHLTKDNPQLAVMYGVTADFLGTAFSAMEEAHGTVENYLTDVLAVDIDALRAKYLY